MSNIRSFGCKRRQPISSSSRGPVWVWVLAGLASAVLSTAQAADRIPAAAVEIRDNELAGVQALATFLYSSPMGASMRKCVAGAEATGNAQIRAEMSKVAGLPTRSSQQQKTEELSAIAQEIPSFARANCMVIAMMYLEHVDGAITVAASDDTSDRIVESKLVPAEVTRLAGDLTAGARGDLAFLLENYRGLDAVQYCGPWLSGTEFRRYVLDEETCGTWLKNALREDVRKDVYVDFLPKMWEARVEMFLVAWELCLAGEDAKEGVLEVFSNQRKEQVWNTSCRIREAVGLPAGHVVKPDFSQPPDTVPKLLTTQEQHEQATRDCGSPYSYQPLPVPVRFVVGTDGRPKDIVVDLPKKQFSDSNKAFARECVTCVVQRLGYRPAFQGDQAVETLVQEVVIVDGQRVYLQGHKPAER